ncbi:hypothetical protein D3C87_1352690 [compost metagenome]
MLHGERSRLSRRHGPLVQLWRAGRGSGEAAAEPGAAPQERRRAPADRQGPAAAGHAGQGRWLRRVRHRREGAGHAVWRAEVRPHRDRQGHRPAQRRCCQGHAGRAGRGAGAGRRHRGGHELLARQEGRQCAGAGGGSRPGQVARQRPDPGRAPGRARRAGGRGGDEAGRSGRGAGRRRQGGRGRLPHAVHRPRHDGVGERHRARARGRHRGLGADPGPGLRAQRARQALPAPARDDHRPHHLPRRQLRAQVPAGLRSARGAGLGGSGQAGQGHPLARGRHPPWLLPARRVGALPRGARRQGPAARAACPAHRPVALRRDQGRAHGQARRLGRDHAGGHLRLRLSRAEPEGGDD